MQVTNTLFGCSAQALDEQRQVNAMRTGGFDAAAGRWVEQFFFHLIHTIIVSLGSLLF